MADEATVRSSLQIRKDNLQYSSLPSSFMADVSGTKGPVPGALAVDSLGTLVDFSELTTPGLCRIHNLDADTYIEYGIWDPETAIFFPLGEVQAGESYILRLSRNLQAEYGTGSGTATTDTNRLKLRAPSGQGSVNVVVEAFEK